MTLPFPTLPAIDEIPVSIPTRASAQATSWRSSIGNRSIGLDRESEEAAQMLMALYSIKFAGLCRVALVALADAVKREASARGAPLTSILIPR